ncbi:hypothetical protein QFZ77_004790 [Paenibacillus sp. V4I3]|uniref:hypothetical protein n=1 Tax=Paenibacillus sp. V4I3 TaxID=3042305 RepID=UPI00278B3A5C|nr:hypothetical protein [Paenibacillus sp. V4I3]MDQ0876131.1 hypothetical protein [Paenibacillus sp. V4I3]
MITLLILAISGSVLCSAISVIYTAFGAIRKDGTFKSGMLFSFVSISMFGVISFIALNKENFEPKSTESSVVVTTPKENSNDIKVGSRSEVQYTIGKRPSEFLKRFNELTENRYKHLIIKNFDVVSDTNQDFAKYIYNDSLGIFSIVNKSDGSMRDVTLIFKDNGVDSRMNFIRAAGMMIEIVEPGLSIDEFNPIIGKTGISEMFANSPDFNKLNSQFKRNGFTYTTSYSPEMGVMFNISSAKDESQTYQFTNKVNLSAAPDVISIPPTQAVKPVPTPTSTPFQTSKPTSNPKLTSTSKPSINDNPGDNDVWTNEFAVWQGDKLLGTYKTKDEAVTFARQYKNVRVLTDTMGVWDNVSCKLVYDEKFETFSGTVTKSFQSISEAESYASQKGIKEYQLIY